MTGNNRRLKPVMSGGVGKMEAWHACPWWTYKMQIDLTELQN